MDASECNKPVKKQGTAKISELSDKIRKNDDIIELEEDNILIKNSILFNLFPNQKNIILIRKGDFRKSFIQDKYNPTDSFSFDN